MTHGNDSFFLHLNDQNNRPEEQRCCALRFTHFKMSKYDTKRMILRAHERQDVYIKKTLNIYVSEILPNTI